MHSPPSARRYRGGLALATAKYDGIVFEMEHNPGHPGAARLPAIHANRRQIAQSGSLAPAVTPIVRIPPNGGEKTQFHAKQALDLGAYGIVWPHISTVDQAYNAVAACRYPRLKKAPLYEPAGMRGDGPTAAVRYWGLTQQEYYERADVWPLNPKGEIFVILMIEDTVGIANLSDILKKVPGIGAVLIGEGDLSQELGYPRQYEHQVVLEDGADREHLQGKPTSWSATRMSAPTMSSASSSEGYRFLMAAPVRSYGARQGARAHRPG